jgi:hypothetical protein
MAWPASASERFSSDSSERMLPIFSSRWLASRNDRYAVAVVAKPPGTRMPCSARLPIISPSEAFLPPTRATSAKLRSSNHLTTPCSAISGSFPGHR